MSLTYFANIYIPLPCPGHRAVYPCSLGPSYSVFCLQTLNCRQIKHNEEITELSSRETRVHQISKPKKNSVSFLQGCVCIYSIFYSFTSFLIDICFTIKSASFYSQLFVFWAVSVQNCLILVDSSAATTICLRAIVSLESCDTAHHTMGTVYPEHINIYAQQQGGVNICCPRQPSIHIWYLARSPGCQCGVSGPRQSQASAAPGTFIVTPETGTTRLQRLQTSLKYCRHYSTRRGWFIIRARANICIYNIYPCPGHKA